jgi:hypothetical protein
MLFGSDNRPLPLSQPSSRSGFAYEHPFDAAKRTGYKGYFYFPTLEPSELMPVQTRDTVNKKAQWLYNNVDAVGMAIDGLSVEEVDGGIWPKARTSNPAFNRRVTSDFDNQCSDARFFHSDGTLNYFSGQFAIRRETRLFGECFGQFLRPTPETGSSLLHLIKAWQCNNANTKLNQDNWRDGMNPPSGRVAQYRFLLNESGSKFADWDADDVLHFHDPFFIGQRRQMSSLAPVVRKLFTADDIERAEANGALLRARVAYAITRTSDDAGAHGPSLPLPGAEISTVTQRDGSTIQVQKIISPDGDDVDVLAPPAGFDFKVIESGRAVVAIELLKWFLIGLANSQRYPVSHVFTLGGLGTGTEVRSIQKRVQRMKNFYRQMQLGPQFCVPWYRFWLWQRIKAGIYDDVPGGVPTDWYLHRLVYPADDTIDIGREGKLWDSRLETGKVSWEMYCAVQGEDADDVEDEIIAGAVRRAKKLEAARAANPDIAIYLTNDAIFRPPVNTPPTAPVEPDPGD